MPDPQPAVHPFGLGTVVMRDTPLGPQPFLITDVWLAGGDSFGVLTPIPARSTADGLNQTFVAARVEHLPIKP